MYKNKKTIWLIRAARDGRRWTVSNGESEWL
jgi:hypothetical protein